MMMMENLWNNQKPASQSSNQTNNQPTIIIINNIVMMMMMISNWNEKKKFQNPPWKSWMVFFFWLAVDVCRCLIMFDDGVVDPFNHSWIEEKQKLRKGQGRSFRVQASSIQNSNKQKNDAQNWTNLKNRKTEKNDKNYKIRITIMYISGYFFFVK